MLCPDEDFYGEARASLAIIEAQRHSERGICSRTFSGLLPYFRQTYIDLVEESNLAEREKRRYCLLVKRFFDPVQIEFGVESAKASDQERVLELESTNRFLTNEKSKYLTVFENLSSPVFVVDEKNRIDNMNRAAARFLGQSAIPGSEYYCLLRDRRLQYQEREEDRHSETGCLQGESVEKILPWLSSDLMDFSISEETEKALEKAVEAPQGSRHVLVHLSRLMHAGRKFAGSVVVIEDITERKRTEEDLAASRARFTSIVERSADGMLVVDSEGRVQYANESATSLFRRSKEDVGKIWFGTPLVHSEMTEVEVLRSDGTLGLAEMRLEKTEWEGKPAYLAMLTDVTERRKAKEAQRRLATAVEHTAETIVVADSDGIIQYVNPAFERSSLYNSKEVIGKKTKFWHTDQYDEKYYDQLVDTIQSGKVWAGRFVSKRKDGTLYCEDATVSPVRDATGEIVNFVAVKRDITRQLELEQQVRTSQKMEAVGTLAGGIAHDFNNILQVAIGYSELILADKKVPHGYRADLQKIYEAGKRGADLVQRLLTFSRKTEIRPKPLDLNRRVYEMRKMLDRTIPKMIDIQLVPGKDLAAVNADPTQVDQILMNLAVNARDAMPDGGKLVIETAVHRQRKWESRWDYFSGEFGTLRFDSE